jgi:DNA-binding SARP family transcriptional activator
MNIMTTKNISENLTKKTTSSNSMRCSTIKQQEIINLLDLLERQAQSSSASPRKIAIDHAIQICQLFLNNLLETDWHKHLYEQAKSKNKSLNDQLTLILKLLDLSESDIPTDDSNTPISDCTEINMGDCPSQNDTSLPKSHSNTVTEPAQDNNHTAKLDVYFLGTFRVYKNGKLIDCMSKSRAKQLLKYLILNRTKSIPKEILMDRFWPDHDQNSARNNLNVAVYCLRQALKNEHSDFVHILFQDGCYHVNNNLEIRVDTEIFEQHVKAAERLMIAGKTIEAVEEFKSAELIYQGDFLAEDLYEDWSLELREHYKFLYIKLLGKLSEFYYQECALDKCIDVNRKITSIEVGDETAHRRLMECFARLNQRHLALKQYQLCQEVLAREFELKPSQETLALHKTIKAQELCEKNAEEKYGLRLKQA